MNKLQRIIDRCPDTDFIKADGFDDAVIGYDSISDRLIYSVRRCLLILMNRDKMLPDEAQEFFEFNVSGAFVGEKTPIWCEDCF
jgi:hypothetical protein